MGIQLLELLYFAISSPTEIAVAGFPQISIRDFVETTCHVKAGRNFVGDTLNVYETVLSCRADRPLVQAHGIEVAAFYSCDFCPNQCGTIFEILGAILHPYFKLF